MVGGVVMCVVCQGALRVGKAAEAKAAIMVLSSPIKESELRPKNDAKVRTDGEKHLQIVGPRAVRLYRSCNRTHLRETRTFTVLNACSDFGMAALRLGIAILVDKRAFI